MSKVLTVLLLLLLVVALVGAGAQASTAKLARRGGATPPRLVAPPTPVAVPPAPAPPAHWNDVLYESAGTASVYIVQSQQGNWPCIGVPLVVTLGDVGGERVLDFRPLPGGRAPNGDVQNTEYCDNDALNEPYTYYNGQIQGSVSTGIHAVSHFSAQGWANLTLYPKSPGSLFNDFSFVYDAGPGPYHSRLRYVTIWGSLPDPTLGR